MTHKPTNLGPEFVLWEEPTWQLVKANENGVFSSRYIRHLNSVLVHRCDPANVIRDLPGTTAVPRNYITNQNQLKRGCSYCEARPSADISTLWILHNADCFDNTQT
jgi:hypothetical protein